MFSLLAVLALVLCESAVGVKLQRHGNSSNNDWDFLLYVERWPGTLTQSTLPRNVNTFTLHGMWAERNDNTWPQFCDPNAPYQSSAIASIKTQMDQYWPNLQSSGTSDTFWSHEWEKHGTCAADGTMPGITDELSFFQYALQIHAQMPYIATLQAAGIVPSTSQSYSLSQIQSALNNALNFTVVPSCMKVNGQNLLMRLYSCISKQGALINCPSAVVQDLNKRANCGNGQNIGIPPIQH